MNCDAPCCARPLYLLIVVSEIGMNEKQVELLKKTADVLREENDLMARYVESRANVRGTRGVKICAYSTLERARAALESLDAAMLNLDIRELKKVVEAKIERFSAEDIEADSPTWNGTIVSTGRPRLDKRGNFIDFTWIDCCCAQNHGGDRKNPTPDFRGKAFLVVEVIEYHGTTRMMEIGLYDREENAEKVARRLLYSYLPDEKHPHPIGLIALDLDKPSIKTPLSLDYSKQLSSMKWITK